MVRDFLAPGYDHFVEGAPGTGHVYPGTVFALSSCPHVHLFYRVSFPRRIHEEVACAPAARDREAAPLCFRDMVQVLSARAPKRG